MSSLKISNGAYICPCYFFTPRTLFHGVKGYSLFSFVIHYAREIFPNTDSATGWSRSKISQRGKARITRRVPFTFNKIYAPLYGSTIRIVFARRPYFPSPFILFPPFSASSFRGPCIYVCVFFFAPFFVGGRATLLIRSPFRLASAPRPRENTLTWGTRT